MFAACFLIGPSRNRQFRFPGSGGALFAALFLINSFATAQESAGPVVSVTGGKIQGRALAAPGGAVFKGIPYAQAPLGDLRWHEPVDVKPWTGTRDAGTFGRACVQQISGWNKQEAEGNQEDCLYLNVWTAEWPAKSSKPVMVWLHGGGNTGGAASVDYFDGTALSRRGIVLVTINYRLGLFGFFVHPGLTAESPHHSSGNYGLLDQVAALKWVAGNIRKFGGDPKNVTVFGQSAGSVDTSYMLATPLTKGMIAKAIQESGPPIRDTPHLTQAEEAGVSFGESLKAPAGADAIRYLRSLPATELQKAAVAIRGDNGPATNPVIDGWVLPKTPPEIYEAGMQLHVPIIIGNNAREQPAPRSPEALKEGIKTNFGSLAAKAGEFYGVAGEGKSNSDPLYGPAGIQFTADTRYRCGAIAEAIWVTSRNQTAYEYQFDHAIAGRAATQHSAEVPYVFGNLLPAGFLGGPYTDNDHKISDDMQQYWTNFAKTGNPNGNGLPAWPKFDAKARAFLEFTDNGPVAKENLRPAICNMYIENLNQTLTSR